MKGGNTFWIIWGGVLVLWLVLMQGFAGRVALAGLFIFAGLQVTKAAVQKVWSCPVCGKPLPVQTGLLGVVVIPVQKCPHCGTRIP